MVHRFGTEAVKGLWGEYMIQSSDDGQFIVIVEYPEGKMIIDLARICENFDKKELKIVYGKKPTYVSAAVPIVKIKKLFKLMVTWLFENEIEEIQTYLSKKCKKYHDILVEMR